MKCPDILCVPISEQVVLHVTAAGVTWEVAYLGQRMPDWGKASENYFWTHRGPAE